MKNFEKYEKEILNIVNQNRGFGLCDEKITECATTNCSHCEFCGSFCYIGRIKWLYEEYTEPKPTITTKEKHFLEAIDEKSAYIARDRGETLMFHIEAPTKYTNEWSCHLNYCDEFEIKPTLFPFIKWEDDEPWSVEELLKLEVKDE